MSLKECLTFYIFPCIAKGKVWYSNIFINIFRFILSARLSNSLWGSVVLLFSEFINIVSTLFYNFIEFIILLDTFLVIFFSRCKEYIIFLIIFSKFSGELLAFTCAKDFGNLWSICLGVDILKLEWSKTLSKIPVPSIFIGNIC